MNTALLTVVILYGLMAVAVVALAAWTRWSLVIKIGLAVGMVLLSVSTFDALAALLGFPTPGRLPDRMVFHSVIVNAPNKTTGSKGAIYLWATTIGKEGPEGPPRSYELPFDKETFELLNEASRRAKQGIVQMASVGSPEAKPGATVLARLLSSATQQKLKVSDLNDPALPEK